MKFIFILVLLSVFFSCAEKSSNIAEPLRNDANQVKSIPEAVVGNYVLRIMDVDGRCVLSYRFNNEKPEDETRSMMGISAPCEFMRDPNTHEPLIHTYQEGVNRRSVLNVTGGPASQELKDEYMPSGCGTQLQKLFVFGDRVEIGPSPNPKYPQLDEPRCPSSGLDEVHFAV